MRFSSLMHKIARKYKATHTGLSNTTTPASAVTIPTAYDSNIHRHLQKEGVPLHLVKRLYEVLHHSVVQKKFRDEVSKTLMEAVEKKREGKIGEESLTKIISETINESDKISKEELKELVHEMLCSELQKYQESAKPTYIPAEKQPIARETPEEQEFFRQQNASFKSYEIPLPSIEEGGMIRRKYAVQDRSKEWESHGETSRIVLTYPLYFKDGKVHVYASIKYDPESEGLLYRVVEPQLLKDEQKILEKIEQTLIEELEVDFSALKEQSAERYLKEKVDSIIEYYGMKISERTRNLIDYYISRDFIGFERIEPMMQDPNLEDISCDGVKIPIYIYHRDPRIGSVKTNIVFEDEDSLNSFVMKLAQRCNRSISVADPLLDGSLPDGSRVQATFGTGISMKGSNFTIRKFTKDPLTFIDLMNYGTVDAEILAYLWIAIEHGKSILIAGPTASGKTTLLNSLSLFIRPELKVISIEDTPELKLPHENWISQVARSGFGPEMHGGKKLGEISLFDLLKASLRQRPDIIVVGEVRGKEAYVLFQQMATGHPGLSTIHAESLQGVINRLSTPPINLPASLIQHLNVLLVLTRQRVHGKYLRRTKEIIEILGYDIPKNKPVMGTSYFWKMSDDTYHYTGRSYVLKDIMEMLGTTPEGIYLEIERRMRVIKWMHQNNIRDYKNVGRIISEYYQNPSKLLEKIL